MTDLPAIPSTFHGTLADAGARLDRASDTLAQLTPWPWAGLKTAPDDDSNTYNAELRQYVPHFAIRYQIASRRGFVKPRSGDLLIPVSPDQPNLWQFQPVFYAWPYATPSYGGISLFDLPTCTLKPGDYLYLSATWIMRPGQLLDSSGVQFLISSRPLPANDSAGIPSPLTSTITRTWNHLIAIVSPTGAPLLEPLSLPFIPPELL